MSLKAALLAMDSPASAPTVQLAQHNQVRHMKLRDALLHLPLSQTRTHACSRAIHIAAVAQIKAAAALGSTKPMAGSQPMAWTPYAQTLWSWPAPCHCPAPSGRYGA